MKKITLFIFLITLFYHNAYSLTITNGLGISAKIVDLNSKQIVYEQTPQKLLYPASNQKIMTLYAAQKLLSEDFHFTTQLYTKDNNAYVKFTGDPNLSYEQLEDLLRSLGNKKFNQVIIDTSDFADEYYAPGWLQDQSKFCFQAPISAAIVDDNCQMFDLTLDGKNKLIIQPHAQQFIRLANNAKLTEKENDYCEFELSSVGTNSFRLHGCYTRENLPSMLKIAVNSAPDYVKANILTILKNHKVEYKSVKTAKVPQQAQNIATLHSNSLSQLLSDMMVNSHNQIAETLFMKIAQQKSGLPGSWKNGAKIMTKLLQQDLTLADKSFQIADGSGLSRKNLLSADLMVAILQKAYEDPALREKFLTAFPQAGVDGTMKERFKGLKEVKIFAKTGSAENTSALSGYAFAFGKSYAFSIIINGFLEDMAQIKNLEEAILLEAIAINER